MNLHSGRPALLVQMVLRKVLNLPKNSTRIDFARNEIQPYFLEPLVQNIFI
jgi:hypothetical protein